MFAFKRPQFKLTRNIVISAISILLILFTYTWHLTKYLPGASPNEIAAINSSSGFQTIFNHPVNAPYLLINHIIQKVGLDSLLYHRLLSVVFGLLFIFCFYKVTRTWFGKFISAIASLVFATTPLVILTARTATPEVMYLLPLLITVLYFYISKTDEIDLRLVLGLVTVCALSLYTPGMLWLLVVGLYLAKNELIEIAQSLSKKFLAVCGILFLLLLTPLIIKSVKDASVIKTILLIPDHFSFMQTLKSIVWSFSSLLWQSSSHNLLQVGRLPLLNYAEITLSAFGVYALWSRARDKVYGLLGLIVLSCLGYAFSGLYEFLLTANIALFILFAAGLRYLYMEWRGVFPLNPLPRALASTLIFIVALINIGYGVRFALLAWPNTVETKSVYVLKLQGTKGVNK